jgi:UDP-glucose:(heptosyl)LPS alpha-1,3-glucosyltransferase
MRIALVVHDYHRAGGHARYVVELAERFSREHEVHVFANRFDATPGISFHHVPAWRKTALTTILTFLPGTANIRGFDIVHAQGLCSLRADVITTHICNRAWYAAQKRLGYKLSLKDRIFDTIVSPMEKRMHAHPKRRVIAISEKVRRDIADAYGRSQNVDVIYHGVDAQCFSPSRRSAERAATRSRFGFEDSDFVFLYVGDLRKGASVAIEALARTSRGELLLVSATPNGSYVQIAEQRGVRDRVTFSPAVADIAPVYAAADAFVFPTPYDAFGMVISEAMASALPVITSREAGAAEWLTDGDDGVLLRNPADPAEVGAQMQRLADDPQLCRRLGESARCVAEQHTWEATAQATMHVYQAVLAQRKGVRA